MEQHLQQQLFTGRPDLLFPARGRQEKTGFANAFRYHRHLSQIIPQLHWWISSSLCPFESSWSSLTSVAWHTEDMCCPWAAVGVRAQASWLQPFLSDPTRFWPVKSQRGGCSQGCPGQQDQDDLCHALHQLSLCLEDATGDRISCS